MWVITDCTHTHLHTHPYTDVHVHVSDYWPGLKLTDRPLAADTVFPLWAHQNCRPPRSRCHPALCIRLHGTHTHTHINLSCNMKQFVSSTHTHSPLRTRCGLRRPTRSRPVGVLWEKTQGRRRADMARYGGTPWEGTGGRVTGYGKAIGPQFQLRTFTVVCVHKEFSDCPVKSNDPKKG